MVVHKATREFRAKRFRNDMWWISNFINVVVVQMHQCTTSKSAPDNWFVYQKPRAFTSTLASSDTDEESDAKSSPLRSCRTGSTAMSLQTSLSKLDVMLRRWLCCSETKHLLHEDRACCNVNLSLHLRRSGRLFMLQPYRMRIRSQKRFWDVGLDQLASLGLVLQFSKLLVVI